MPIDRIVGIIFAALLGGVLGSFANVLIIRWHEDVSIGGRSACPQCKTTLKPRHMIPVLSWFMLGGRCASCRKKIHFQYPLVEATAALLGIVAALRHDPFSDWVFWFEFIVSVGLLVPVVMDIRWQELPVEYLAGLGVFSLVFRIWLIPGGLSAWLMLLLAAGGATAFFGLQWLLSRGRWLGSGDIWFGALMGCVLGWPGVALGIYAAYVLGGLIAALGLLTGILKRGSRLPFAPALAAGTLIALWFGPQILAFFRLGYANI
ncbi:MAG: prepilin peptidase [Patescibacteria group bacterium]